MKATRRYRINYAVATGQSYPDAYSSSITDKMLPAGSLNQAIL